MASVRLGYSPEEWLFNVKPREFHEFPLLLRGSTVPSQEEARSQTEFSSNDSIVATFENVFEAAWVLAQVSGVASSSFPLTEV